jgi:hypothetical protein
LRNDRSLPEFRETVAAFIGRLKDEWHETN